MTIKKIFLGWSVANWRNHYLLKCPEIGKTLSKPFTRFQLGMFYSLKIYLFWKIWLVSLKLTVETGVNLKTKHSSRGSNHFHMELRGIYDLLSINKQTNQANSSTQEIKLFFLQFCKMHLASFKKNQSFWTGSSE